MPKVSIIIPVYNTEKYLKRCIESCISQTFSDIEIILINDGSADGSGAICDMYAELDSRIVVIHQKNAGVCAARNAGLDCAVGKYIVLLDSDDYISPVLIEHCLNFAENNDLDCLVYSYKSVNDSYNIDDKQCLKNEIEIMSGEKALEMALEGKKFRMLSCNKFYKADLWNNVRFPVGRKYGDDTSVTYRLLDLCKSVGYTKNVYYFYVSHEQSALHAPISELNLQLFDAYDELILYIKANHKNMLWLAYYAYNVRIFDFLSRINLSHKYILLKLRKHIKKHTIHLIFARGITIYQRALLCSLIISNRLYFALSSNKIRNLKK